MREPSRLNAVATAVALLEKHTLAPPTLKHLREEDATKETVRAPRRQSPTGTGRASTDDKLESAIESFNSVAEDVERIVAATNSLKRNGRPRDDESDDDDGEEESEGDDVGENGLETITEQEERNTSTSVHSSEGSVLTEGDTSSPDDEGTVKGKAAWSEGSTSNQAESTSDLSTSSSDRPPNLRDSSTRCNSDFQWFPKEPKMDCKPPINRPPNPRDKTPTKREKSAPGSLDRRRYHHGSPGRRLERDQKSRSTHAPPKLDDYLAQAPSCQGWCHSEPSPPMCYETFHRRHERIDPQRYGSSPMLMEQRFGGSDRGSHPDLYGDCGGRFRHESPVGCCSYHAPPPPCCFFSDSRSYHWTPPPFPAKFPEHDERLRKLQGEKDNLQLQVQVLTEQIEAQTDKISDLEKTLSEKKHLLNTAEDVLQREVLSRSSLETQKLELLSAISELKLQQASLERENLELRAAAQCNNNAKPPPHTSTPVSGQSSLRLSSPGPGSVSSVTSPRRFEDASPKTPPATYRRQIDIHYGSLPRQQFISNGTSIVAVVDANANPARKGVAFGRGISSLLGGRARGRSVPNLAESEKIVIEDTASEAPQSPTLSFNNKNKGIKKILGKIKRSNSGTLDDIPGIGDFQRGGVRATAAARLGWSEPQLTIRPDKPFAEWDTENVCDWLQDLSLDQYIPEAKKWVKSGQQLQEASTNEIEKELGIRNVLHRKKFQLALIDTEENGSSDPYLSRAGKLDTAWVLRWLDDVGLPQYKENFLINRVDGRVLHRLTMDDLALLHVSNLLHVASLKRGIQVLREHDYEPGCLQRRSLPEDSAERNPKVVSLWTTHRVMEWLRAVDLAEYAPNLRGAGVHGGLMVLETKFTAELLATLLSIPPGKTLLRRHLNTHFKELLGKDVIQEKREAESTLGYIPLTPTAKLKVTKKSQFSLKRKKSKGEADYGDLVCPMNPSQSDEDDGKVKGRGCLSSR